MDEVIKDMIQEHNKLDHDLMMLRNKNLNWNML